MSLWHVIGLALAISGGDLSGLGAAARGGLLMSGMGAFQIVLYFTVLTALAWPLGASWRASTEARGPS